MGNRRGRASYFQECFRNVSGGGGEQSREWAQPPPGAAGWRSGPGAARARPGGGWGAWAGRRWGPSERVQRGGRGPGAGPGRGSGWAGRPPSARWLPAPRPGETQFLRSAQAAPGGERKSPKGGRRGEEGGGERQGEPGGGAACPFVWSRWVGVGRGGRRAAPSIFVSCVPSARLVGRELSWLEALS